MMFEPSARPRIFAQEPGADFPAAVARGLRARLAHLPPEAMAEVEILVNTGRMLARLRAELVALGPGFLPRLRLVSDLGAAFPTHGPAPLPMARLLQMGQAVRGLLRVDDTVAPASAAFALARSLGALFDEMQTEGVDLSALDALDVSDHSRHWNRALAFIRIVGRYLGPGSVPDAAARQRLAVAALAEEWRIAPPAHPVLVVGSTGSRGATQMLMQAVARLPQGALVLPGFDFDMPASAWLALSATPAPEDHPQYRYAELLDRLEMDASQVGLWAGPAAPDPARNRLLSLALRPVPVTDRWREEGPALGDLRPAVQDLTLIEAPSERLEAVAIAVAMRTEIEAGGTAALITPDRTLARRVTVALDRWGLRPDDSAGRPLGQTAPGRLLRQVAALMMQGCDGQALLALGKHPLAHSAAGRGPHLLALRALELHLRRRGMPLPTCEDIRTWAERTGQPIAWADWLAGFIQPPAGTHEAPLGDWLSRHRALAETAAAGPEGKGSGGLWQEAAGERALSLFDELAQAAPEGGDMSASDYFALFETLLAGINLRETYAATPGLMIWGTLEARVQGAGLVVLAGLNEGGWPEPPAPDPWLNRALRRQAGLLLPERQIGLSAHDFQQGAGAERVIVSRAARRGDAPAVPSRWVNRLVNLLGGLPAQHGPEALTQMKERGRALIEAASALSANLADLPAEIGLRNPRPAPAPPAKARPATFNVTAIKTLIRDPYAIYAELVLGLRQLDPLRPEPDARLRGTALHRVLEAFTREVPPGAPDAAATLSSAAAEILAETVPWPMARVLWHARLDSLAEGLAEWHANRTGTPAIIEARGRWTLPKVDITLIGRPDRIDLLPDGTVEIFDYKTGQVPSPAQQDKFDKQLILLALMAENGGFAGLRPAGIAAAAFVGLGAKFTTVPAKVDRDALDDHLLRLERLFRAYQNPEQGFAARRAMQTDKDTSPFDALARLGEWQLTDPAITLRVGDHDG